MRTVLLGIVGVVLAFPMASCLDPEPATYIPREAGITVDVERPADVPEDVDPKELCLSCVRAAEDPGPGCKTAYDTCFADSLCGPVTMCASEAGCLSLKAFSQVLSCGSGCAVEAGVVDATGPTARALLGIIACVTNAAACLPFCGAP